MQGYLSLVLHAHLPFIRQPEHGRFLEETWLFEAITETYIPLLQLLEKWEKDGLKAKLTLTLTPTLCSMLSDSLLRERYFKRLDELVQLAEKEMQRTVSERALNDLAVFYHARLLATRAYYNSVSHDLVGAFREMQDRGRLEIITSAATHAVLPLLAEHPASLRAQILIGRDHYRSSFGCEPRGMWLPECAYSPELDSVLQEAGLRWFIVETHGILLARPRPRGATFAPILSPSGAAAFGRDRESAEQVWSRKKGYPADPRYRDFYRDIGFDLEVDYLNRYLPAPGQRGFTGFKYYSSTNGALQKEVYDRLAALEVVAENARHFIEARQLQLAETAEALRRPPILVCPYDAELFGHWWYEGPEFLDQVVRNACRDRSGLSMITPEDYLQLHPTLQVATPAASSWGEAGYWDVWLNEKNEWIYSELSLAQERMAKLAKRSREPDSLQGRALKQAARELLLAQASDWPFIIRAGTSPDFAEKRVKEHLHRFSRLYHEISNQAITEQWLKEIEARDNIFPDLDYRYWAG